MPCGDQWSDPLASDVTLERQLLGLIPPRAPRSGAGPAPELDHPGGTSGSRSWRPRSPAQPNPHPGGYSVDVIPLGRLQSCFGSSRPVNPTGRPSSSSSRACPAGLELSVEELQGELARRRLGYGRGPRMRFEQDEVTLLGGVRHGRTLGSPVAIEIGNTEWPTSGSEEMSPATGPHGGAAHPAPARSRRPGRHAEVRLRRRPRRPGAGLGPRDRGPRRRRVLRQGAAGRDRRRHRQPRDPDGARGAKSTARPAPADLRSSTPPRCAASTPMPKRP